MLETLVDACLAGDVGAVRAAIAAGDDVNAVCSDEYWTPLSAAAACNCIEAASMLLVAGAHVNPPLPKMAPLHHAAHRGHTDVCELLLRHGARTDARGSWALKTPTGLAAQAGHLQTLRVLLAHGACTRGALWSAACHGREGAVRELLHAGVHVDETPAWTELTPLGAAVREGHEAVADLLEEAGADLARCGRLGRKAAAALERVRELEAELGAWRAMPAALQEAVVGLAVAGGAAHGAAGAGQGVVHGSDVPAVE